MPTSHYKQIPDIIAAAIEVAPQSVLEIGIGCGKYGALLREYLTVWDHYYEPFDMQKVRIEGIEIHDMYSSSPMWVCYNRVYMGDAVRHVDELIHRKNHYDMVLMVDVLEHFEVDDGIALLNRLLELTDVVLVGLPRHFFETVEVWDNPHEIHRAEYPPDVLRGYGFDVDVRRDDDASVMLLRRSFPNPQPMV